MPTQLALLTKLSTLYVGGTQLHGPMPTELFQKLPNLEQLNFANGPFTGSLPSQIGLLANRKALDGHWQDGVQRNPAYGTGVFAKPDLYDLL
jgi:hypothetical protein